MHSPGEFATRGISRKTTTQGFRMPPLGLNARARIHLSTAHETAGAARTRHSPRPRVFEGEP